MRFLKIPVILAILGLAAWQGTRFYRTTLAAQQETAPIPTAKITRGDVRFTLSGTGLLEATHTVMVISDATGETAERMVRAAVLQFSNVPVNVRVYSQVRLESEVEKIIERAAEQRALLVFTVVNPEERDLIWRMVERYNVDTVDLIGALMSKLAAFLSSEPSGVPGLLYTIGEDYFRRIEAVEFAVKVQAG